MRGWASSTLTYEGWSQVSTVLVLQHLVQHLVCIGLCGNTGKGHQNRPQLQEEHGARHGHKQQLGSKCHQDLHTYTVIGTQVLMIVQCYLLGPLSCFYNDFLL